MNSFFQLGLCVFSAAALSCRAEGERANLPDFVGGAREASGEVVRVQENEATVSVPGVDLIQDILFRAQRDGWTLLDPSAHTSIDKLRAGGLGLVFASLPAGERPGVGYVFGQMEAMEKLVAATGDQGRIVAKLDTAKQLAREGKQAFMFLLEGAEALQGELDRLPELKARGLSVVGIVSPRGNAFGDAAYSPRSPTGLTNAGRELLHALVKEGIAVDLTHASPSAFWEALCTAGVPILVTHTASAALQPAPRNLDDLQVIALASSGGLLGLILNPELIRPGVRGEEARVDDVVAHLERWKAIGAGSAIALGTDFGGIHPPAGLKDVSALPDFFEALRQRGWSEEDLSALKGENAWRVLGRVLNPGGGGPDDEEALHPLSLECGLAVGEIEGTSSVACDGFVLGQGVNMPAESKLRLRLSDMRSEPVRLELFADPGTLWQIEGQNVNGRPLSTRLLQIDERGRASVSLPARRGMARVFVSPTRTASLHEAVVWGRWPSATAHKRN